MYWWDSDPTENVYIEITDRKLPADDLLAPLAAHGGATTGSYRLVPAVGPSDVVLHYDTKVKAIVGASIATGGPEPATLWWVAHGANAIKAGAEPSWLPGVRVPLAHFTKVDPPVTLHDIRTQQSRVLGIRDDLLVQHGEDAALYFPWVEYSGQQIRTFQTYLAKVPRALLDLFPVLVDTVAAVEEATVGPVEVPSETQEAADAVERAAGTGRGRQGQGYMLDQQVKVAIEAHAMNEAIAYYLAEGWDVEDVHGGESYDLCCTWGSSVKHVEVKGTTTDGSEVILTPNEARHAREYQDVALFIVRGISAERDEEGGVHTTGGEVYLLDPWTIADGVLKPVGYRYKVPVGGDSL